MDDDLLRCLDKIARYLNQVVAGEIVIALLLAGVLLATIFAK